MADSCPNHRHDADGDGDGDDEAGYVAAHVCGAKVNMHVCDCSSIPNISQPSR